MLLSPRLFRIFFSSGRSAFSHGRCCFLPFGTSIIFFFLFAARICMKSSSRKSDCHFVRHSSSGRRRPLARSLCCVLTLVVDLCWYLNLCGHLCSCPDLSGQFVFVSRSLWSFVFISRPLWSVCISNTCGRLSFRFLGSGLFWGLCAPSSRTLGPLLSL